MYRNSSTIDLEDKILASEIALHRNPIFHDTPYHLPRRCVLGGRSEFGLGWILAEELRQCGNGVVTSKQFIAGSYACPTAIGALIHIKTRHIYSRPPDDSSGSAVSSSSRWNQQSHD